MLIKMVSALLMVTPFWWVSCGAAGLGAVAGLGAGLGAVACLGADVGTDAASCADAGTAVSGAAGLKGVCVGTRGLALTAVRSIKQFAPCNASCFSKLSICAYPVDGEKVGVFEPC